MTVGLRRQVVRRSHDLIKKIHAAVMIGFGAIERMARPVCKGVLKIALFSLRQRIRSRALVPAKMEIRAAWSS